MILKLCNRRLDLNKRILGFEYLLLTIENSKLCCNMFSIALSIQKPCFSKNKLQWCYIHGLEGLQKVEYLKLNRALQLYLKTLLNVGQNLEITCKSKYKLKEKLLSLHHEKQHNIPKNKHKNNNEEKDQKEQNHKENKNDNKQLEKKDNVGENQKMLSTTRSYLFDKDQYLSVDQYIDIYRILLQTISYCQLTPNDANIIFEENVVGILFDWERTLCCLLSPISQLHKMEKMWNELMNVIASVCEGIFQWATQENNTNNDADKLKETQIDNHNKIICEQVFQNIIQRLTQEIEYHLRNKYQIKNENSGENNTNEEKEFIHELRTKDYKTWKDRRIQISHECIYNYLQLLHRLRAFPVTNQILTHHNNDKNNKQLYLNYLFILLSILYNHHTFFHHHHILLSLCVRAICDILPTFTFEEFDAILQQCCSNNGNSEYSKSSHILFKYLPFENGASFIRYLFYNIGKHLYIRAPHIQHPNTIYGKPENEEMSSRQHGTYSIILRVPEEMNAVYFIQYLLPFYLNHDFNALLLQYADCNDLTSANALVKINNKNNHNIDNNNNDSNDNNKSGTPILNNVKSADEAPPLSLNEELNSTNIRNNINMDDIEESNENHAIMNDDVDEKDDEEDDDGDDNEDDDRDDDEDDDGDENEDDKNENDENANATTYDNELSNAEEPEVEDENNNDNNEEFNCENAVSLAGLLNSLKINLLKKENFVSMKTAAKNLDIENENKNKNDDNKKEENLLPLECEEDDNIVNWLKKIKISLHTENYAILFTGKLLYCDELASILANKGAIVYIEKARNITDRNINLIAMNQMKTTQHDFKILKNDFDENDKKKNYLTPIKTSFVWNHYFMNGIMQVLMHSNNWNQSLIKHAQHISNNFCNLFETIGNNDDDDDKNNNNNQTNINNVVNKHDALLKQLAYDLKEEKIELMLGILNVLVNNDENTKNLIYRHINHNYDHKNLFRGCRVRVTHFNRLQFEGTIVDVNCVSSEIIVLLDNFYLTNNVATQSKTKKPFEIVKLSQYHNVEIIDFTSNCDIQNSSNNDCDKNALQQETYEVYIQTHVELEAAFLNNPFIVLYLKMKKFLILNYKLKETKWNVVIGNINLII